MTNDRMRQNAVISGRPPRRARRPCISALYPFLVLSNIKMKLYQIVTVLCVCCVFVSARADLLPNQSFTEIDQGALASWQVGETNPPALIRHTPFSAPRRVVINWENQEGKPCLKMFSPGGGNDFGFVHSPKLRAFSGYEYELKVRYRAKGLVVENPERTRDAAMKLDIYFESSTGRVGMTRILANKDVEHWTWLAKTFKVPEKTEWMQVRLGLDNKYPDSPCTLWVDAIDLEPVDPALPNPGFEAGDDHTLTGWAPFGGARSLRNREVAHAGACSVSVSDAPDGPISGWSTEFPVRPDRSYSVSGYIKGGEVLNPNGFFAGGVLALQFINQDGQAIGKPSVSPAVPVKADWTRVSTPQAQPPAGAVSARIVAGLQYTNGTAYFDDLVMNIEKASSVEVVKVRREKLSPSDGVAYARNLLVNGDIESVDAKEKPIGWTYIGESSADWTPEQVQRLHANGRPEFSIGRGLGEVSHDVAYSGKGALVNISIDPPLSKKNQWYGRSPVDGYWISDPIPAAPGRAYMACGWVRGGKKIDRVWFGPLELQFFDAAGKKLPALPGYRSGMAESPAGEWSYWATPSVVAPAAAQTMRLRFGQELQANEGGWGRTYADNLAVWEVAGDAPVPNYALMSGRDELYRKWYALATAKIKPPYMPSPAQAPEYTSVWGVLMNQVPGNLYDDPNAPTTLSFELRNILGESRSLSMQVRCYDAWGNVTEPVRVDGLKVDGYSAVTAQVTLPPAKKFGALFVDASVYDGKALVGTASGRYAVLPPLTRPHSTENRFAVTPLINVLAPYQDELGKMFKAAGFGIGWERFNVASFQDSDIQKEIDRVLNVILFYQNIGMRTVVQIDHIPAMRPINAGEYEKAGRIIARGLKGKIAAIGNWGIEQSNNRTEKMPIYRPIINGKMMSNEEYDTILSAFYKGLKSQAPEMKVLIGNIATDVESQALTRLYGKPGNGQFDGAIINAYYGIANVVSNALNVFDRHGDAQKEIWLEEQAMQSSPGGGDARRYGEIDGAYSMVRTWVSLLSKFPERVRSVTMWGFVAKPNENGDISMATPDLQPRPQFVAHAVMSDALADATFMQDLSGENCSLYKWSRGDGPLIIAWANAGERDITLEVPRGSLILMDVMGNRKSLKADDGVVTVHLTTAPVFLFDGGALSVSGRLDVHFEHSQLHPGDSRVKLTIQNNMPVPASGEIYWNKPLSGSQTRFNLPERSCGSFDATVSGELPSGRRSALQAQIRLDGGGVFGATAAMNFATALRASKAPALDGTWGDWSSAQVIEFGDAFQVFRGGMADDSYKGPSDIRGKWRMMWDNHYLYLGVESVDDRFVTVPERGRGGFAGDSIEFSFQPGNTLNPAASFWEYELYLPSDGKNHYAASRRAPLPQADMTAWQAIIKPTGTAGNAVYQVAIPWADLGVKNIRAGMTISFALVLNDADVPGHFGGGRKRIRWFEGIDTDKNPQGFGDVTLIEQE